MTKTNLVTTPFDAITYKIIGCAMAVHRQLGPGYKEDTYQKALELKLSQAGICFEPQKWCPVYDEENTSVLLGYYIPDFIVEEKVIVEIKALHGLDNSHKAQVIGYLAVTHCPISLLINFGCRSLQQQRIFPPKNISEHKVNRQWLFVPDYLKQPN